MTTKIMKCTCKHEYQDKKYGKQNRVFNQKVKANEYRCTVCSKEITYGFMGY